jgi:hemolysin III
VPKLAAPERPQSLGEEIANSVSHGVAVVAALFATPFLLLAASRHGASRLLGASVFSATILLLYLASTLYHALRDNRAKRIFRFLDHAAIFFLIAGTYTPFTLGVLRGAWGWTLLAVVWGLALTGVILEALGAMRHPVLSTGIYLMMGWLVVVAIHPLWIRMPAVGLFWLVAGGVAYTVGTAFFAAPRLRYSHLVFHLFVVAGTACHFVAVWGYAA